MHEINSSNNTEWGRDPIAYSSGSKGVQMLFRAPLLQTPRALLTFTPNIVDPQLPQSVGNLAKIQGDINSQEEIEILSKDLTNHYKNMSGGLLSKISRGLSRAGIKDPEEAQQYRAFRDEQIALKSALKESGVSEHDAEEVVKLHLGEKNYSERVKKQTARAIAKINREKKRLSGGTIVNTKEEDDYSEGVDQNEANPDSYTTDELLEMRKAALANRKRG